MNDRTLGEAGDQLAIYHSWKWCSDLTIWLWLWLWLPSGDGSDTLLVIYAYFAEKNCRASRRKESPARDDHLQPDRHRIVNDIGQRLKAQKTRTQT
uniref:Secreted protein n=1 Tax=Panagrellus redivivus TaxID=6233 RepID=A0A7E4VJ86_PANRE